MKQLLIIVSVISISYSANLKLSTNLIGNYNSEANSLLYRQKMDLGFNVGVEIPIYKQDSYGIGFGCDYTFTNSPKLDGNYDFGGFYFKLHTTKKKSPYFFMNCGKTYLVKSETEGVNLGKSLKFDYGIGINLKAIGVKSVLTAIELGYSENYFSIIGSDSFEQTISQKDHHHNHFRISFMLY